MSIFLFSRGGAVAAPAETPHVVEGVVATFDRSVDSTGTSSRPSTSVGYLVTLADQPPNLTFRLTVPPEGGIAPGARVRLEVLDDPREVSGRARSYPDASFVVRVVGATVDGQVVYTATAAADRAGSATTAYRLGAVACLVLGLGWAGVTAYRHRAAIRSWRTAR
jgi:hypothetical protein